MKITKTQFKAELDHFLDNLKNSNEDIIIIDDGKPIFKVSRYDKTISNTSELFAPLRGNVKYYEDLTLPTTNEWNEV